MNLPNRLTLMRILLIPPILVFLLPFPDRPVWLGWNTFIAEYGRLTAFLLFAAASITDLLDGKVARSRGLVTTLGKFLDPIADKMLVVAVLVALVQTGRVHALIAIIVIIREFVITGVRLVAVEHGVVIAAGNLGKAKTVSQVIAILLILAEDLLARLLEPFLAGDWISCTSNLALWLSVVLTVWSGLHYLVQNRKLLRE